MFGCVGLAMLNVTAYFGHLDTGDQAGFGLGNLFLAAWFLPMAAIFLLIGAIWVAPARQEGRLSRGIAIATLIAGAAFFLAYAVWLIRTVPLSRPAGSDWLFTESTIAAVVAFSGNMLACSLAVRPGSASLLDRRSHWLFAMILLVSAIVISEVAAFVLGGIVGKQWGDMQAGPVLFMGTPTVGWIAMLLSSVRVLHRRRRAMRGESAGRGEA